VCNIGEWLYLWRIIWNFKYFWQNVKLSLLNLHTHFLRLDGHDVTLRKTFSVSKIWGNAKGYESFFKRSWFITPIQLYTNVPLISIARQRRLLSFSASPWNVKTLNNVILYEQKGHTYQRNVVRFCSLTKSNNTRQSEGQLNPLPQRTWMCISWLLNNHEFYVVPWIS
jgi:hypothetical protein